MMLGKVFISILLGYAALAALVHNLPAVCAGLILVWAIIMSRGEK